MAKTLIGNIKGKNGRGIASIKKTGTTGSVDTYTITYTDNTTSTFTINNSDSISLQRQIVPSAAVESSTTASQAYTAGDYVVVGGVLRKVTSSITKGSTIGDSNSTVTTVTGEIATARDTVSIERYTLEPDGSSSVIELNSNCRFAASNGYINLVIFGKLAYVYWRGLNLSGAESWGDGFTINKKLANNNAWIDVVMSNGKSSIQDCGFEARGDTCTLVFKNTSSNDVKTSAFAILELA